MVKINLKGNALNIPISLKAATSSGPLQTIKSSVSYHYDDDYKGRLPCQNLDISSGFGEVSLLCERGKNKLHMRVTITPPYTKTLGNLPE